MGRHSIKVVYSDFEIAAMNAVQDLIPSARIQGCLFHLSQSVYRRVCASGLQSTYNTQEDFAVLMRMFPSLAFLPTAEIPEAFQDLLESFRRRCGPSESRLWRTCQERITASRRGTEVSRETWAVQRQTSGSSWTA
ncbi:uncharacterized protein LOC115320242 [Ixodes scapularis]|uniref:uncharacterized protein LOC115320242 n=1 Tax=Ixodes scapularis TaxID=6945 RepID=UPI001A9DE3DA|nr:uncharacterized protein LOC115320242 [Ixodes scapularis]XP_040072636.1 uncharacterized protein LOC115320242 [Ixodes scapularis]